MDSPQLAYLTEGLIPVILGGYFTLLGYRKVGKRPGVNPEYDMYMNSKGGLFKKLGPIAILFGLFLIVRAFL
jgi:hypothetical protein